MQNSVAFLCTSNKHSDNEVKETIPFMITSRRIKYLGTSLTKEGRTLYSSTKKHQ